MQPQRGFRICSATLRRLWKLTLHARIENQMNDWRGLAPEVRADRQREAFAEAGQHHRTSRTRRIATAS